MSRFPILSRGGSATRSDSLTIMTSIISTTMRPILTTLNRMGSQNRMDILTRMGRLPWMTILIRPTWPSGKPFLRRMTWLTSLDRRT